MEPMEIPDFSDRTRRDCDVLVIGGGTAGTMAALTAAEHGASVLLLDKAHVRHSGALAMGMDGVNNAVIPARPHRRTTSPRSPAPMTASSIRRPSIRRPQEVSR